MKEGIVRCIKIVHPIDKIRLYRILSAFFRFVGIFVCENIAGDEYGGETDWKYEVRPDSENPEKDVLEQIRIVLQDMKALFETEVLEALDQIADIFVRYDLMRCSYALEYFGDTGKEYIYEEMKNYRVQFEAALKELEVLETECGEGHAGIIYIWAAKSNCKRRSNEIHSIIWNAIHRGLYGGVEKEKECLQQELRKWHFYRFEEISGDIVKILRKAPGFYGAHVIRGFSMELDDDYRMDSFVEMKRAVEKIGEKSYASYVYYRMGRYCEKIRSNLPVKMNYYKKAYEVDNHNYRAIHKLAVHAYEGQQYEEMKGYLGKVLDILEDKENQPSLQPIECAYLYKTYSNLGKACIKLEDYDKGRYYLMKAENVFENTRNEDSQKGFYPWMFGNRPVIYEGREMPRWKVYKSAAREKLMIKFVYAGIANIAIRKKFYGEYSKYSTKMLAMEA